MGAQPKTKAECDKKIADLNLDIARLKKEMQGAGEPHKTYCKNSIIDCQTKIKNLKILKSSLK